MKKNLFFVLTKCTDIPPSSDELWWRLQRRWCPWIGVRVRPGSFCVYMICTGVCSCYCCICFVWFVFYVLCFLCKSEKSQPRSRKFLCVTELYFLFKEAQFPPNAIEFLLRESKKKPRLMWWIKKQSIPELDTAIVQQRPHSDRYDEWSHGRWCDHTNFIISVLLHVEGYSLLFEHYKKSQCSDRRNHLHAVGQPGGLQYHVSHVHLLLTTVHTTI